MTNPRCINEKTRKKIPLADHGKDPENRIIFIRNLTWWCQGSMKENTLQGSLASKWRCQMHEQSCPWAEDRR